MKTFPTTSIFSIFALIAALAVTFAATPARADDQFYALYGGEIRAGTSPVQKTYTFEFEYMHDWNENFSFSIDNGNLGHFNQGIEHHIDYDGASIWAHKDFFDHQLRLAAGVGTMLYYDTTGGTFMHADQDVHGLGTSYTMAATLYTFSPLLLQVRTNWINTGGVSTRALMLGVGYQFGGDSSRHFGSGQSTDQAWSDYKNEITIFGGKAVINEPGDGHSTAFALEYRHDFGNYVQWSETFLDEGKSALADRSGLVSEAWLAKSFFDDRLSLGVGVGVYLAHDSKRSGSSTFVAPIRSYTVAYNLTSHLDIRATWDRPITNDGRDSDVARFGIGYRF